MDVLRTPLNVRILKNTYGWVLLMRQHSKKCLVEVTLLRVDIGKQYGTTVVDAVILEGVNNWRNIFLKKDFEA